MDYERHAFENETVRLDENTFADCGFSNCIIEYSGGPTSITGETTFKGKNTVQFLGLAKDVYTIIGFLMRGIGLNADTLVGRAPDEGETVQ